MTRRSANPLRDEILGRAAVSHYAEPAAIASHTELSASEVASALFGEVVTESDAGGAPHWVLRPNVRRRLLAASADRVRGWLATPGSSGATDRILREWLEGRLDIQARLPDDYDALMRVAGWLIDASWVNPPIKQALSTLACEELRRRLDRCATDGFVGRATELTWITRIHDTEERSVVIEAKGGMGKSALLAKALLDCGAYRPDGWLVFVIDFDDPGLSVSDPDGLFTEVARQAAIQLPEMADLEQEMRSLSNVAAESDQTSETRGLEDSRALSLATYLFSRLAEFNRRGVIVFDTLERAMHRAPDLVGTTLRQFLDLTAFHPWLSVVISGRGPVVPELVDLPRRELGPLDKTSASTLLGMLAGPDKAERIMQRIPQLTPLTLRLAARAVNELGVDVLDDRALDDAIRKARIDGYLQRRILGHLATPRLSEVAELAFVLRVITPRRLLRIVGPVLDAPIATLDEATGLLNELAAMTDLVTSTYVEERRLVLRPEVGDEIAELAREAHPERVGEIHRRAAEVLGQSTNPDDLEEAEFHASQGDVGETSSRGAGAAPSPGASAIRALRRELPELLSAGRFSSVLARLDESPAAQEDPPSMIFGARAARAVGDRERCRTLAAHAIELTEDALDRARGHVLIAWAFARDAERARAHRSTAREELSRIDTPPATLADRAEIIGEVGESDRPWAIEQLRQMFEVAMQWTALRDADRNVIRCVCALIGTATSMTWAAQFGAFSGTREVDYQRLARAIADTATTVLAGTPDVLERRLREHQHDGSLDSVVTDLVQVAGKDASLCAALADVLDQLRADQPEEAVDTTARAGWLDELASRITQELAITDWREMLTKLGSTPIATRSAFRDDGLVVRGSLGDIDRRKLGRDLVNALRGRDAGTLVWAAASLWRIGDISMLTGVRVATRTLGPLIAERGNELLYALQEDADKLIKILRNPLDTQQRGIFNRNARLSREMAERYPESFVPVHALDAYQGYALMDRCATATDHLSRSSNRARSALAGIAAVHLARALRCLHAEGLAHGDLRAETVFVSSGRDEVVFRLGDLQVVEDHRESQGTLQIPRILRQAIPMGIRPDHWLDLLSLTLLLWWILTGESLNPAMDADGLRAWRRQLEERSWDHVVVQIALRMVGRNPYVTVEDFEAAASREDRLFQRKPLVPRPTAMFDVFLSYDSQDVEMARAVSVQLAQRGLVPYFDQRQRSRDRVPEMMYALDTSRAFAILIGRVYGGRYQATEVGAARDMSRREQLPFKVFLLSANRPAVFSNDDVISVGANAAAIADELARSFRHPIAPPTPRT